MIKEYAMLVRDRVGVLSRITAYVRRNGWNVESLHVVPIVKTEQSRLTITLEFTQNDAERFEQRLREWNFVFEPGVTADGSSKEDA